MKTNPFIIRNFWSGAALKKLLSVILFIGFVVLVEYYFGWTRLLAPWKTLSAGQIFAAVGLAFVSYWTRAMRLYDYFRPPRMAVAAGVRPPATLVHPCTAEVPGTHDSMDGGGRALPGANAEEQLSGRPPRMAVAAGVRPPATLVHPCTAEVPETHDSMDGEGRAAPGANTGEQFSSRQDMQGAFGLYFKVTLQHNLLNNLLPMRAGEISFPLLMMRHFAVPMARSIPALLWFRLLDLHTLGACALLAGWAWSSAPAAAVAGGILLLAWILLPLLLFWGQGHWQRTLQKKTATGKLHLLLQKTLSSLPQRRSDFWRAWAWTVITWAVKLAVFTWVLLLFMDIAPTAALMGVIAGDLTSVLPVHGVAGMGTYEAGVIAGLLPYGITLQNALPAAVNLHLFLLASTLIGGAISLFLGRLPREEKSHE